MSTSFNVVEATIADVQQALASREITVRGLVQLYLDRIEAYDRKGPQLNSVITLNPNALREAERLDRETHSGPLHGLPIVFKDQGDIKGMPTTLGSVLFKDYYPDRDCFVADRLRKAGAILLAKTTLGELGGGDTHGSLFGSTRNPYDPERTAGGSSGGSGVAVAANFATVAVGQEGYASIRRPSTWNGVAGMRPTPGLVSRGGVYDGWPDMTGSLGPMARTVKDMATLLDVMVGYDPEDPATARGVAHIPGSYTEFLKSDGLAGARLGILREPMGYTSEPDTEDFRKVTEVFDKAVADLVAAGAEIIDPIVIPGLRELLEKRAARPGSADAAFKEYFGRSARRPFEARQDAIESADFAKVHHNARRRWQAATDEARHYRYLLAREELTTNVLKVMADNRLDAIVHKSVEHQPTLIREGMQAPFVNMRGAPHLNTFLVFASSVAVPAGFTRDDLPAGITFFGRPYDDGRMIQFAYAYEQATRHRRAPTLTPAL